MNSTVQTSYATMSGGERRTKVQTAFAKKQVQFCAIVDEDAKVRHALTTALYQLGLETVAVRSGSELAAIMSDRIPNVVFVDIDGTAADTLGTMLVLKQVYYPGLVQLMGHGETAIPKYFAELGRNFGLNMLPHLQKPLSAAAIRKIVDQHSLGGKPIHRTEINLQEAIDRKWVEFWYQPKIDFATRRAVGAELCARVNHPEFGVLGPQSFMPDADAQLSG